MNKDQTRIEDRRVRIAEHREALVENRASVLVRLGLQSRLRNRD
jgi:hypothetical protein